MCTASLKWNTVRRCTTETEMSLSTVGYVAETTTVFTPVRSHLCITSRDKCSGDANVPPPHCSFETATLFLQLSLCPWKHLILCHVLNGRPMSCKRASCADDLKWDRNTTFHSFDMGLFFGLPILLSAVSQMVSVIKNICFIFLWREG
jgi:hypothetical protein